MFVSLHGFMTWSGCGINAVPLQAAGRWRLELTVDANNSSLAVFVIHYYSTFMCIARALLAAFAAFVHLAVDHALN